jgi:mycofactocin precursor
MSAGNTVREEDEGAVMDEDAVLDELLVEEVSIDGLCGVY